MSILQFVVDTQWSLMLLVLVVVGIVWVRRMSPETRRVVRGALMARGVKASVGSVSLEVGAPANVETLATAAATDDQLTKELEPSESETTEEQVQQIRRDAVERLMREAAEWGWTTAQVGFTNPPVPQIAWNGDHPEINYAFSSMEQATLQMTAPQGSRLYPGWQRFFAGQQVSRGSNGGRSDS
ncbi:hypothetical protein [Streptacidiphilus anmyonensis]|uniref:hypothetical protein n=1 Tax=Streptacidiphilus anmyonensis TaxID=405782 RepID=UPI0005A6E782|nr:hypothetical protein [Streptacidiphilus anmyonensis]